MLRQRIPGQGIVENHAAPCGEACNKIKRFSKRWTGKIHHYAKPCEDSGSRKVQATVCQLLGEVLMLEIHRNVMQARRLRQSIGKHQLVLPLLRGRMINLKDLKTRMRIAMRKRVQSCSQHNILANAIVDCLREIIFSQSVACD